MYVNNKNLNKLKAACLHTVQFHYNCKCDINDTFELCLARNFVVTYQFHNNVTKCTSQTKLHSVCL